MLQILCVKRIISLGMLFVFLASFWMPVHAEELLLPAPGRMVNLSPVAHPVLLKGIKLDANNPFRFNFFVDQGKATQQSVKAESAKLIKYFLASLTIPEKDLWVTY